jgi:hypothetical protein
MQRGAQSLTPCRSCRRAGDLRDRSGVRSLRLRGRRRLTRACDLRAFLSLQQHGMAPIAFHGIRPRGHDTLFQLVCNLPDGGRVMRRQLNEIILEPNRVVRFLEPDPQLLVEVILGTDIDKMATPSRTIVRGLHDPRML